MNCLYCHNECVVVKEHKSIVSNFGYYDCTKCPVYVRFYYFNDWDYPAYISFVIDQYLLELTVKDNLCELWKSIDGKHSPLSLGAKKVLMKCYLPSIDVNNAQKYLKQLLSLMAFS